MGRPSNDTEGFVAQVPGDDGMVPYQVGYFVGSLSSTSINRVLSKALIRLARTISSSPRSRSATCPCTARTTTRTSRRKREL